MSIEIYGKEQEATPMPGGNDWIFPGSDIRPPIEDDWALYLDPMKDDVATLQAGAAAIMQEWAGITSVDGRIFSGREQKALDPREYYQKAIRAFREGSLDSLWSDEYREFHEAKARGDKAAMRAMAAKKIKGEGVGHAVREAYDKYSQSYLADVERGLNSIRDALSPEELAILDAPRAVDPEYEALLEEDSTPSMYDSPAYGLQDPQRAAVEARQAQLDRERFDRHDELYRKHHSEIEGERRLASYERQLEDENLWAVIESLKGHISDGAQHVVDMALQRGNEPTSTAVMNEFEKLSTPEQRSIAGILQALHYSRGDGGWTLARDAGNAFMDTLESVTVGAVRGAADLVRRTWMDGDEYRDMVERRVLLEDANRERMNDWGYLGNTVIGVASTIPYMAAAAIPYVGMADMIFAARDQFQGEAMRNGVDVSSLDFILGSSAFAIAYAYVEKIQWERMGLGSLDKLTNLSRRQMYCDMFHSVRAALGVAGAVAGSMLTESGEEGIQRAMEVVVEKWGGATLADAVAGFTEDFVQSLGTMAILGTVGAGRQHIAFRHGALGYDKADAVAAQGRSVELERLVLGHPGEVGPLASYGRTYGRMVEHWLNAGTDADTRQAALRRWGLDAEQAQAIHGALQNVWTAIEGADTSAETKAEQKSALVGGGHVLTAAELVAQIQNGSYHGKVEQLDNGAQAVDLNIAGRKLRIVIEPKRDSAVIDPNDASMFESIVNALNERNVLDADGAKFTVEGWEALSPEERQDIIAGNGLVNQGHIELFDQNGNKVASMDGRVLDAITGRVTLTDAALPQTAFHETMHGVLNLLTNMATGEKSADGGWKVAPDKDAAALIGELAKLYPAQSAREAVNEEALSDAFQAYLTGKIDVVEHTGLLDRLGRFLANLFGYGGKTHEFATPRTAQQRLFNTAITGHVAQALQAAEAQPSGQERDQAGTLGDQAPAQGDQVGEQGDQDEEEAPTAVESVLQGIEERHPDLAETVAMFRNRDPLTREQMQQLRDAADSALDDAAVMNAGYRWNEAQDRWDHFDKLDGTLDERDMPSARGSVAGMGDVTQKTPSATDGASQVSHPDMASIQTDEGAMLGRTAEKNVAREVKKRKRAENELANYAAQEGKINPHHIVSELGRALGLKRNAPSLYRAFTNDDGTEFSVRLSNHRVNALNYILQGGNKAFNLSIAVIRKNTGPFRDDDRVELREYEYLEADLTDEDARKIASALQQALANGGQYADPTGKLVTVNESHRNGYTLAAFANEGASSPPGSLARDVLSPTDDARDTSAGTPQSQTPNAPDVNSENPGRHHVSPRLPSPEFAMDGTIADALPAHLREDARAIIAERANTPAWMVEPDGTPTDLNERDWLRREAEKRHEAGRRFAISGLYTGSAADYAQRDADGLIVNGPSLHKVGTGEGNHVYGWGLYASAVRGVAEEYAYSDKQRKRMESSGNELYLDGKRQTGSAGTAESWAVHFFDEADGDRGKAAQDLREAIARERELRDGTRSKAQRETYSRRIEVATQAIQILEDSSRSISRKLNNPSANLYEQTFFTNRATPEETERHLLTWFEKPSAEQIGWFRVAAFGEHAGLLVTDAAKAQLERRLGNLANGGELYQLAKDLQTGTPGEKAKAASEFLARAGIDGIKYPVDSYGKTVKDGNKVGWNYVSFRDDNIRVDHKWVNGERRYQIAGRAGAERLGIRGLGDAEAMERSGATREEIWRETGWWRGKDGEWRVEVPDITPTPASIRVFDGGYGAPLSELVHAPELMAAYPELADIPVFLNSVMGAAGQLTERNGRPVIELNAGKALEFFTFKNGTHVLNEYGVRILSHEIQHAIQLQEGFARGASPEYWQRQLDAGYDARPEAIKAEENRLFEQYEKERAANPDLFTAMEALDAFTPSVPRGKFDPDTLKQLEEDPPEWKRFDKRRDELEERYGKAAVFRWFYLREKLRVIAKAKGEDAYGLYRQTAGEVESRNVEKRLKMTPEERAATPPWETEDVEEGRQIVRHEVASNIAAILSRFEEAKGKSKQEIFAQFDNTQKVIGALPDDLELPPRLDVKERVVKGAEAYILNHILNEAGHETQYTAEDARRVLGLIDPANEMRVVEQRGSLSLAFIAENPNGGWDCIVIAPKRGEFFIFKTMFGQKRKPYQGKTRIRYSVAPVRRGEAANLLIRGGLTSIRDFSGATPGSQAHPGGDVNWEGVGRGSVAGSDPGWFDLEGQLVAAEREARETARHGLAFGGARFSNRSWVEAFAARDKALKIERSDEDYERLIAALGLAGKMTAADARESAEALQREVKGGAGVIADLVKAAEKKNFRQTVEKIVSAAHGYGIEVGANAYQAWERFLSEMRRTAKGRDAADFTNDTGWDLAELLWAANEAGFELQRKGKPTAAEGAPLATGGATDEEMELEAALIDGREGDLGLTAEEARERLRKLAEERMGDVEGRRSRLRAALEAWRKSEAARIEKLRAEREAKEAAKATAEADATAGMDDRADAEGKHKGERPEEENEDEAVEEMPDFKAFCERLKAEGLDLENPGEVAYVMRWYVEDWMAKKSGKAPGEVLKDPVAAAQYRRTVLQLLRDAANKLLDPNDGMAAKTVERMIGEIPGDATANEIQSRSRSIIGFIKRNAIRQSRKQLVKGIQDDIQKQGIKGKKFDETEKDIGRKITGEREFYCLYLKRILNWGSRRIAAEQQRLNDIITGRLAAYKAARGEDAALEALQTTDREIHRATERLNALQLWGGLRTKSPAEIARAGKQIHEWLERERDEHEKRWSEWMAHNDEMAARIVQAVSASMGEYTPDDPGAVGQLADLLTTNFRSRLERLAVGSGAEGRRAIDEVMMLVYAGSERLGVLKAQRRQRTDAMLARCVEGTGQTVGEFLKSLDENIPEELNRRLTTEEQPTRMTWGQALQLLGSLEQTASYKRNIDENGRGAVGLDGEEQTPHRDLILQALADKPQMLRLVEEMRKIYDEDREAISREFFAVTGNAVLTPDPLYLPARMFTGARENLETTVRAWNPFGPAFTPRIANKRDFDLSASIMDVYNERMKETATALAFGMRGMELRSVLARKSVQEAIARTHGKFALRKMIAHLTDIVSDGYNGDGGQLEGYRKAIRTVGDLTTYSALSWNVVTMLKQMTSIPAWTALLDGGYGEIFRHIVHFDAAAAKELMASPGFTARYGAESFARMFRQELENPQGGNVLARFYKAGMTAVQMGDFVPGILVGTGVYKARKLALMRKGLAEGAAREQAARETWGLIEENQQSSRLENTPEILRRGGFIGRQLSKFASSPMMQVGHEVHTLRMWLAEARLEARHGGKESGAVKAMLNAKGDDAVRWRKRFVNQFVCNHVLMPAAMYAIATVFKAALGGEPPDKEEVYGDLVMQMVAGPWSRIFLLGAVADTTGEWAARLMGGKPNVYSRGDLAATQHLHKAMSNAGRLLYDAMDMDWASCRDDFVKMASSYNAPFRYAATITQNATGYDPAQARRRRKREIAKREAAE